MLIRKRERNTVKRETERGSEEFCGLISKRGTLRGTREEGTTVKGVNTVNGRKGMSPGS